MSTEAAQQEFIGQLKLQLSSIFGLFIWVTKDIIALGNRHLTRSSVICRISTIGSGQLAYLKERPKLANDPKIYGVR